MEVKPMLAELVEKIEQKNLTKGKLEGKLEGKFETAEAMLKEGISVEMISRCTGLTKEEIDSIT